MFYAKLDAEGNLERYPYTLTDLGVTIPAPASVGRFLRKLLKRLAVFLSLKLRHLLLITPRILSSQPGWLTVLGKNNGLRLMQPLSRSPNVSRRKAVMFGLSVTPSWRLVTGLC